MEEPGNQIIGDARVALNSFRFAAREAENKGLEQITGKVIKETISDAYDEERHESLESLNRHQKAV